MSPGKQLPPFRWYQRNVGTYLPKKRHNFLGDLNPRYWVEDWSPYLERNVTVDLSKRIKLTNEQKVFFPPPFPTSNGATASREPGTLIIEALGSQTTPHSVGLLWTSDQPDAETST